MIQTPHGDTIVAIKSSASHRLRRPERNEWIDPESTGSWPQAGLGSSSATGMGCKWKQFFHACWIRNQKFRTYVRIRPRSKSSPLLRSDMPTANFHGSSLAEASGEQVVSTAGGFRARPLWFQRSSASDPIASLSLAGEFGFFGVRIHPVLPAERR